MKHLLFLEDEAFQIDMIRGYYQRCPLSNPDITTAEFFKDPLDAINRLKKGGIDYVITDIRLGESSGYTFIGYAGRVKPAPKIWAYTAYPQDTDGRNKFIEKYILKSSGLGHLFSKLEAAVLAERPPLIELVKSA